MGSEYQDSDKYMIGKEDDGASVIGEDVNMGDGAKGRKEALDCAGTLRADLFGDTQDVDGLLHGEIGLLRLRETH